MAVSGSFDFNMDRDAAIKKALQLLGVLGEGASPTAQQLTDCSITLNMMLKHWQNREVAQNLIRKFYVFLDDEVRVYDLSTTAASSSHSSNNFYSDVTVADYADGATDLEVDVGTGAADADTLLLVSDEGALLDGAIDSGGTTESLTVEDLDGNAESGNRYFAYTTKAIRPLDILYVNRCFNVAGQGEDEVLDYIRQPCVIQERRDFSRLAAPDSDGAVNTVWYDPQWPTAELHVWPEPDAAGDFLEVWGQFTIDDMDAATDDFALPSRWYLAVSTNLAYWLMGDYGASADTRATIREQASIALREAEEGETEDYIQISPDRRNS
jgi:hypothetical protein